MKRILVVLAITAVALPLAGAAQEGQAPAPAQQPGRTAVVDSPVSGADWPDPKPVERRGYLSAKVGTGCLMTLPDEVERVALADDSIARVQIISPREVLLTGLVPGRTTVHVWLADGRRMHYLFQVVRDLDLMRSALKDLDPGIEVEVSPDGRSVVLRGEVADERTVRMAIARAETLIDGDGGGQVLSLLRHPGSVWSLDEMLEQLLQEIDPRIRVKRIQVGPEPSPERDTFVLEGRVKTLQDLTQAVTLAERQLGGTGGRVEAQEVDERVGWNRQQRFFNNDFTIGGGGGGGAGAGSQALRGRDPRSTALSAQVARGLVVTSESGRVVSLLEVDDLPQVMVKIRVLEVNRGKARRAGINFRIDSDNLSIGSYTSPGVNDLPGLDQPDVSGLSGNLVGAFVDQTLAIAAAIDFLQTKDLARAVAEPNVLTLSGELATVVVGGEIPIPTTAATTVTTFTGVSFQDFGVRLDIRPTVTDEEMVALEVAPSIVRPAPGLAVNGVPGFQVQRVTTTARVRAGQSLILGGLLGFEEGLQDRRVPGLGKIPLFRWKNKTRQEQELLFLITPQIVTGEFDEGGERVDATPEPGAIDLPEINWPDDRRYWRQPFDPQQLRDDGIPPTFVVREVWVATDRLKKGDYVNPEDIALAKIPEMDVPPGALYDRAEIVGKQLLNKKATHSVFVRGDFEEQVPEGWEEEYVPVEEYEPVGEEGYVEEGEVEEGDVGDEAEAEAMVMELEAEPRYAVVRVETCLNLRSSPGTWDPPLQCMPPDTRLEILDEDGAWRKVRTPSGEEGWAAEDYLELEEAATEGVLLGEEMDLLGSVEPVADDAPLAERVESAETAQEELEAGLARLQAELSRLQTEGEAGQEGSI